MGASGIASYRTHARNETWVFDSRAVRWRSPIYWA